MSFHFIDMEKYPRKSHFSYFDSMMYPYVGVTSEVDITSFLSYIKEKELPFFLTFCYCAARAANQIKEFRQRIVNHQIIEYDDCRTSHTVALEDGSYCYCTLNSDMGFQDYLPYAVQKQEEAKKGHGIEEDEEEAREFFFISTLPWVSYTSLTQPVPTPADSNPRITWGKYSQKDGRIVLPVSVLCNHALVDGLHIGRFYEELNSQLEKIMVE